MKCELCSMEGEYKVTGGQGVEHFYCEHHAPAEAVKVVGRKVSMLKIYRPLIFVVVVILASAGVLAWYFGFTTSLFMQMVMAMFFLVFGGLKAITWRDFVPSFAGYDPLAKKFIWYGWLYPAIELSLAVMFGFGLWLTVASIVTIIILSITTVGILGAIRRGETLQCVCLGKLLSLPLGYVTVGENVLMIVMALLQLVLLF